MFGISRDLGIDLGTSNVRIFQKGRGIVLREPSVVAISKLNKEPRAFGEEARQMLGRTPGSIEAFKPIRDGVIANYTATEAMLRYFIQKVSGKRSIVKPRVIICVPSNVTSVERRAVLDAARSAGAKEAHAIEEPMAAAIGLGLPIGDPEGSMVVDIGGGTSDVAVISLGGIVKSESVRIGGNKIDDAIHRYIKREHNITIGERTSEEVKIEIGSAFPLDQELTMEVKGRDILDGMPKTVIVTSPEIREAIAETVSQIVSRTRSVLEQTPPELSTDISNHGIWLTGGGALLRGLDRLIMHETGIPVHVAEDPLSCVCLGTGAALDQIDMLSETHFSYAGMEGLEESDCVAPRGRGRNPHAQLRNRHNIHGFRVRGPRPDREAASLFCGMRPATPQIVRHLSRVTLRGLDFNSPHPKNGVPSGLVFGLKRSTRYPPFNSPKCRSKCLTRRS